MTYYNPRVTYFVKLREREGQRVDLGRSLKHVGLDTMTASGAESED